MIGAEIARRFGEDASIVHAIESHHNEVEPRTLTAVLVQAADAVSAARPGARREALESYVRRLERLEEIASSFDGVERVFPDTKHFLFLREPLARGASHYQFHVQNDDYTAKFGFKLNYENYDFGGERYMKTGECLPDNAIEELKKHDSIFLGAIGHPDVKPGILEKGILLNLRFALDQYINLRPVKLYPGVETPLKGKGPEEIDYVVVRENSGGIYTGTG